MSPNDEPSFPINVEGDRWTLGNVGSGKTSGHYQFDVAAWDRDPLRHPSSTTHVLLEEIAKAGGNAKPKRRKRRAASADTANDPSQA